MRLRQGGRHRPRWRRSAALVAGGVPAYPLDGYEHRHPPARRNCAWPSWALVRDVKQPPARCSASKDVDLRLVGKRFDLPPPDPELTQQVVALLGGEPEAYALAVLDLTDPEQPRYAELRGDYKQNVGSVGKLVVALALFQALADLDPDDIEARLQVLLKTTVVTADDFSQRDHHTVRIFDPATKTLVRRTIADRRQGLALRIRSTGCCRPAPTRRRAW